MIQTKSPLFSLAITALSLPVCSAQITTRRRRRSSTSRIIAGVVVGVLALLALLCLFGMMMRRRRRMGRIGGGGVLPTQLFGGTNTNQANPYVQNAAAHNQPNQAYTGQQYTGQGYNGQSYGAGQPPTGGYSAPNAAPPPYTGEKPQDAGVGGGNNFAPPPGPPPQAHTAHDNQFIGGFRS